MNLLLGSGLSGFADGSWETLLSVLLENPTSC